MEAQFDEYNSELDAVQDSVDNVRNIVKRLHKFNKSITFASQRLHSIMTGSSAAASSETMNDSPVGSTSAASASALEAKQPESASPFATRGDMIAECDSTLAKFGELAQVWTDILAEIAQAPQGPTHSVEYYRYACG